MKVLVFIVAYQAASTIVSVLQRIPASLRDNHDVQVLIIDDCSRDGTDTIAREFLKSGYWCPVTVLRNPVNQGYGGNQKVGYSYAIKEQFDVVVLLHGDGQYAPEALPSLLVPFMQANPPSAVFGSRMITKGGALKGGMPLYKYVGNRILTTIQNWLLRSSLSEFHSGYRLYSVNALKRVPFRLNTNDFHFDTEIIVQMLFSGSKIQEIAIPTFYGDEISRVNGIKYAWNVVQCSIKARLVELGIFFDPKFDVQEIQKQNYVSKLSFDSTHSLAFSIVKPGSVVLDLGCADGYLSEKLANEKNCTVYSVDMASEKIVPGCEYHSADLNAGLPNVPWDKIEFIVFLDVIEHLNSPEFFLVDLLERVQENTNVKILVSSGNVCFFVTRFMMFLGQFNYGRRGILDMTHTRLFTRKSLNRLFRYADYDVQSAQYIPAPYPLALGLNSFSRALLGINRALATILPGLFAYQVFLTVKPRRSVDSILAQAMDGNVQS